MKILHFRSLAVVNDTDEHEWSSVVTDTGLDYRGNVLNLGITKNQ